MSQSIFLMEVHSDPLELAHAACKAVVSLENLSGLFSKQTIPMI